MRLDTLCGVPPMTASPTSAPHVLPEIRVAFDDAADDHQLSADRVARDGDG